MMSSYFDFGIVAVEGFRGVGWYVYYRRGFRDLVNYNGLLHHVAAI